MRSVSMVLMPLVLSMWSYAVASPIEDLASPDQEVRDKAAAAQRAVFKPTPESKWTPLIERISKGQSKNEVLEALRPFNVTEEGGAGSGQSHSQSFRLDDDWILICHFYNEGNVLIERKLTQSLRQVAVVPLRNYTGRWVTYFVDGRKSHELILKDGRYFGEIVAYHSNGEKAHVQHYTEKGVDGEDIGYHRSGILAYQGQHKEGKQVGLWTWYDEAGKATSARQYPEQ